MQYATDVLTASTGCAKQVSGEDADDYKKTVRGQLKALLEKEKDPLGPTNWVVCYIKPAASDPLSKGPRKVSNS